MPSRPVWLAKSRISKSQRAHFAIWILNAADASKDPNTRSVPCRGTVIHVVGSPMAGYQHQFKRNHACGSAQDLESLVQIGSVDSAYVTDPPTYVYSEDDTAIGQLDAMALRIPAPRRSENFMAPVNDITNRRCQEWTMEFIRCLAEQEYIEPSAVAVAQAERDPAAHGIGLRPVG